MVARRGEEMKTTAINTGNITATSKQSEIKDNRKSHKARNKQWEVWRMMQLQQRRGKGKKLALGIC
jgi:hypothetical protein